MNTSPFLTRYQLCLNPTTRTSVNFAASDHISITRRPVPLPPPSCTPSLTTATHPTHLPNTQLNRLHHIQNYLARAVVRAPKSSHINPALKSLRWLEITQHVDYKILSFTHKVLTTTQPSYLYNLISVQPHSSTRFSYVITLSRPLSSSSLKVNNRSFRHASPCLWNQLPKELRLPTDHEDLSLSSDLTHVSSSFPSSPLSPSIYSFSLLLQAQNSSFPQIFSSVVLPFRPLTDSIDFSCFSFSGMSVLTLALCARLSWLPVSF